jgi:hypothetical protein
MREGWRDCCFHRDIRWMGGARELAAGDDVLVAQVEGPEFYRSGPQILVSSTTGRGSDRWSTSRQTMGEAVAFRVKGEDVI